MAATNDNGMELFQRIPVAALIVNLSGRPNFILNTKFLNLVGYTGEEMAGIMRSDPYSVFDKTDLLSLRERLREARGSKNAVSQELKLKVKNGDILYTFAEAETTENNDGDYVLCTLVNITELKKTQFELKKEQKRLYTLIQCSQNYVFEYSFSMDQMTIFFVENNEEMENGLIPNWVGEHFMEQVKNGKYIHEEDGLKLAAWVNGIMDGSLEIRIMKKPGSGKYVWIELSGTVIEDEFGRPEQVIGIIRDINDVKENALTLKHRAERDSLTKLLNNSAIKCMVNEYLENGGDKRMNAMILLDLDDFKHVNDTYGHRFGDKVIKETARNLTQCFGANDLIGRIGGDEYLIFCKDILDMASVTEKLERLFANFESKPVGSREQFVIRASVGISVSPKDGTGYKKLFDTADKSMYLVKRNGKNGFNLPVK